MLNSTLAAYNLGDYKSWNDPANKAIADNKYTDKLVSPLQVIKFHDY